MTDDPDKTESQFELEDALVLALDRWMDERIAAAMRVWSAKISELDVRVGLLENPDIDMTGVAGVAGVTPTPA